MLNVFIFNFVINEMTIFVIFQEGCRVRLRILTGNFAGGVKYSSSVLHVQIPQPFPFFTAGQSKDILHKFL